VLDNMQGAHACAGCRIRSRNAGLLHALLLRSVPECYTTERSADTGATAEADDSWRLVRSTYSYSYPAFAVAPRQGTGRALAVKDHARAT
jgi:hypothetical protein